MFGTLRRSLGSNDKLDVRSAMSGFEKLLKTGIASSSEGSNGLHNEQPEPSKGLLLNATEACHGSGEVPLEAAHVAGQGACKFANAAAFSQCTWVATLPVRVIKEQVMCDICCSLTTKPLSDQALQQLTRNQDRDGLMYPSDKLVYALDILRMFVETALRRGTEV
ncbi:hypothetical protein HPB48_001323 [Haemaphysalis longicornis]|uniref:Uncharacterized protein n=1 Tax=Haemaphysalis longicornis TaxID=44386 RepID=A0A9J6GDD8_HAELO|nr:hypothetical protein HPB48_001323 [Haemaphysalis longicornis]